MLKGPVDADDHDNLRGIVCLYYLYIDIAVSGKKQLINVYSLYYDSLLITCANDKMTTRPVFGSYFSKKIFIGNFEEFLGKSLKVR